MVGTMTMIGKNTPEGFTLLHTLRGQHQDNVWQVAWSPDGTLLASSSVDSMLCLWDLAKGQNSRNIQGHVYWVTSLAWSPDGSILASGSSEHVIRLWNPHTGKCWKVFPGHSGDIHSLAWSPDGTTLASSSFDGTIRLWNLSANQSIRVLEGPKRYTKLKSPLVKSVVWSLDGTLLAAGAYGAPIRLWNPNTGQIVQEIGDYDTHVSSAIWSTNEILLTSDKEDNTIELWYTQEHLLLHSLPNSLQRKRFFACPNCRDAFTDRQVMGRRERGLDWIQCSICETRVSILDREEHRLKTSDLRVTEMNRIADGQRDRETTQLSLQGKMATNDFDVFLCYHGIDNTFVKHIGEQLKGRGLLPWLGEWELRPGFPWQRLLEDQIENIKTVAVFVGANGIGPWQHIEIDAFLREFVRRNCPVIPVILADAPKEPRLPPFLAGMTWVDFRKQSPDPMDRLIWGITGKKG